MAILHYTSRPYSNLGGGYYLKLNPKTLKPVTRRLSENRKPHPSDTYLANRRTLNFLALYIWSFLKGLNFFRPGYWRRELLNSTCLVKRNTSSPHLSLPPQAPSRAKHRACQNPARSRTGCVSMDGDTETCASGECLIRSFCGGGRHSMNQDAHPDA